MRPSLKLAMNELIMYYLEEGIIHLKSSDEKIIDQKTLTRLLYSKMLPDL